MQLVDLPIWLIPLILFTHSHFCIFFIPFDTSLIFPLLHYPNTYLPQGIFWHLPICFPLISFNFSSLFSTKFCTLTLNHSTATHTHTRTHFSVNTIYTHFLSNTISMCTSKVGPHICHTYTHTASTTKCTIYIYILSLNLTHTRFTTKTQHTST